MLKSWLAKRREAKMRARNYAIYYVRTFGDGAEAALAARAALPNVGTYRRLLYRFAARELRRLRTTDAAPKRRRGTR